MAVDCGACDNVISPEYVPGHDVRETMASRNGAGFVSASGDPIPNPGQIDLPMITREKSLRKMAMQAASVDKPLASDKKICDAGHLVLFDSEGSYIYNKETGEVNHLRGESGNYMLDLWIPPSATPDAIRQIGGRDWTSEAVFARQPM